MEAEFPSRYFLPLLFSCPVKELVCSIPFSHFNSDIRNGAQERQSGRGSQGVAIAKMVKNYDILYFFLD
jgi:hypothetical protein